MFQINRGFKDPRLFRRLGNITTTATSDVLVSARPYAEQGAQAQRSVRSTNPADTRTVRIVYLDSSYVLKVEDKTLTGTTPVNTATDIRFIEDFLVVQGAAMSATAIQLMSATGGGGSEICGIGSDSTQSFLCHHYVPAGKQAWALGWGATTTGEVNLKLLGQDRIDGTNLVDRALDLENILTRRLVTDTPISAQFMRTVDRVELPEKSRCRIHVVPASTASTVTRAWFYFWEDNI